MKTNVTFLSAGLKLAGHFRTPDDGVTGPRPAVVVGHPGTGVKEQAAGLYARRLSRAGFATLTFDAAHQGESEGEPRGLEDPAQRVEDLRAAFSFLSTRAEADPGRIGMLGICASGGYVIPAAATDHRVRAVATVSAVDMGRQFREGADGTQDPAVVRGMLDAAAAARTAEARGEGTGVFPVFPATEEEARAGGRHVFEGWEYYRTDRARHPRSATALTWNSVDRIVSFDAFRFIGLIAPRPLLMIAGRDALTSWMTEEAIENAREPKESLRIAGASHVDLYDKEEHVSAALVRLTDFFREGLGDRTRPAAA
jgi:fermentation-respiration switch protein FrsA (DUF1100 family)